MKGLSGLSDFFLRKAFKFALKRNLGKYLASEIDPSQLDVQLGQGTIELRQLLLNCSELNEQLVSQHAGSSWKHIHHEELGCACNHALSEIDLAQNHGSVACTPLHCF